MEVKRFQKLWKNDKKIIDAKERAKGKKERWRELTDIFFSISYFCFSINYMFPLYLIGKNTKELFQIKKI